MPRTKETEDILNSSLAVTPCITCRGKGYSILTNEVCACINKNLPIPEIKDGKLNFILN